MRGIDLALRQAEFRDRFDIKQQWVIRVADLQGFLLRHKPDIVHFSGHGTTSSEIILGNHEGNSQIVSSRALEQLFSVLKDNNPKEIVLVNQGSTEEGFSPHVIVGAPLIEASAPRFAKRRSIPWRHKKQYLCYSIAVSRRYDDPEGEANGKMQTPI